MKREVTLEEISDGNLYRENDMVKVCADCKGCSACCEGMGHSLVLDPYDVHRLRIGLLQMEEYKDMAADFTHMLSVLELNLTDGLILPNMKMDGEQEQCPFLNEEGRCKVHSHRPGICRLFPLGRYYEEDEFYYILQVHECKKKSTLKVKVKKWLSQDNLGAYNDYIRTWHRLKKHMEQQVAQAESHEQMKQITMGLLNEFYVKNYDEDRDFFTQFDERVNQNGALAK